MNESATPSAGDRHEEAARHLRFGWVALLVFVASGLLLEAMHGLKVGFYLDASNETRRLLWTLAHAHGTLLALINVAFAFTLGFVELSGSRLRLASRCLMGATVVMPAGFFLGGIDIRGGDPGIGGVIVAPLGAALLIVGVFVITLAALRTGRE